MPTPRHDYAATLDTIAGLVAQVEAEAGGRGSVGIGIPGAISPATGLAKNANSTWLNGRPLHGDFEARLGRPVRLANDANCFALSEATDGAGAGARVVFGAIVGTGTGGGVVVDGRVLTGANGVGGEWGHNPLPWPDASETPGPECYCSRRGCIELFLSGPGLSRDHRERTGEDLAAEDIAARAAAGDAACEEALRRYESRMARGLATIINVARSRRHRPRGRDVEPRAPLHARPRAMDGVGLLRPRGHPTRSPAPRPGERRARRGVALVPGRGDGPGVREPRTRPGSRWSDTTRLPIARTPATSSPGTAR